MTSQHPKDLRRASGHDARASRIRKKFEDEKHLSILGSSAPDFELSVLGAKESTVRLSALRGQTVVLVFGSYACGPLRKKLPQVNELHERYQGRIAFYFIYTPEAHQGDPIVIKSQSGQVVGLPRTMEERSHLASACATEMEVNMPILVDELSDDVTTAYGGMPNRLYLIDETGYILYRSEMGPEGFKPKKLQRAIEKHLTAEANANQTDSNG